MSLTQINKAGLDEIALDHVFTIGANGTAHYTFQGEGLNGTVNDPTLYLTRGKTYRFENGSGAHPIRIQSTSGASGTAYNTGVTNNAGSGTVIVEVQHDAPDVLYYQCTSHAAMNGIIYVTGALADGGVTEAKVASSAVTTAKIADQAVTLAKLPHGTSSNDGKFLRANNGADPTFETVNTDLVADTSPQLGGDLQSNGNDVDFADNDKAVFGTDSDMQVYHTGSAGAILNDTGQLTISSDNALNLTSRTGQEYFFRGYTNGAAELYHDNAKKLETTSSGATVTGTCTATSFAGDGSALTGIVSFVQGMIILWSGATNAIPSGWVICDGQNNTPDLRDRFVVGAGNSYSVGATGGSNTATDTVSISGSDTVNISVSGSGTTGQQNGGNHYSGGSAGNARYSANTTHGHPFSFSGSGSDTVNISGSDTVSIDTRSPYYALAYIMKT